MKKSFFYACGLGLLMAACQADLPEDAAVNPGEGNVTLGVSAPDAMAMTRAALGEQSNSARGGLTNVDFTEYDLRYQLAVYRIDGDDYVEAITPQVKIVDSYEPVTYSLRLTPNRNYQVVVWADFVPQGTSGDCYYNTANLRDIKVIEGAEDHYFLNRECLDEPIFPCRETM